MCELIESHRLLKSDTQKTINSESLDVEQIMEDLELYIRDRMHEDGIVAIQLRTGEIHVGIGASKNMSAAKNMKRILQEIAPYNKVNNVIDVMRGQKKFRTNGTNENLYALSDNKLKYNNGCRKMYSLNFDQKVLQELFDEHTKKVSEMQVPVTVMKKSA